MCKECNGDGFVRVGITQGDCRLELAMSSDRAARFHADLSEAMTPAIHEEQAKAEERKAAIAEARTVAS